MSDVATIFAEQVSLTQLVQNLTYASGTVGAILVVVGLILIDTGGVRRRNVFNATIEKMIGFFIGFATYFLIGFGSRVRREHTRTLTQYFSKYQRHTRWEQINETYTEEIVETRIGQRAYRAPNPPAQDG